MARLNDEGQWIIMMAFIICVSLFFLAIVVNESTLVGQTTAESVLDFSKSDIKELKMDMYRDPGNFTAPVLTQDIRNLSFNRKNAITDINNDAGPTYITLHYNNGVTVYDETVRYV